MIYLELFWTFFKIGLFTFGGGYAMLPLIQVEVAAHGWMSAESLVNFVAISESTPGPFAINISTYVGMETGGLFGAFCSTSGVVLPSFVIILIVAQCYEKFKKSRVVMGCMSGLRPAVVGMIAAAILSVGQTVFFPQGVALPTIATWPFLTSLVIFVPSFVLVFKKVHPILVILLAAAMGIAFGYLGLAL
ncbi:MAG: chromate transporter [Clostridia bacterium]|nr:chromate transporter [Clostridia bacterium]